MRWCWRIRREQHYWSKTWASLQPWMQVSCSQLWVTAEKHHCRGLLEIFLKAEYRSSSPHETKAEYHVHFGSDCMKVTVLKGPWRSCSLAHAAWSEEKPRCHWWRCSLSCSWDPWTLEMSEPRDNWLQQQQEWSPPNKLCMLKTAQPQRWDFLVPLGSRRPRVSPICQIPFTFGFWFCFDKNLTMSQFFPPRIRKCIIECHS